MIYHILSINPGSTSTRVALYENEKEIFKEHVFHDSSILMGFKHINDQLPYRMQVLENFIKEKQIDMHSIDAVVGRGGPSYSVESGIYEIDERLIEDTKNCKGELYHASMLGVQMADCLRQKYHIPLAIMSNPTVVDEYEDIARVTGVKGVYRHSIMHALNIKEVARRYCLDTNQKYEDVRLIVAHIDGGISLSAHVKGRIIDGVDGGGGDGPLTPCRMGGMAISDFNNHLHELSFEEVRALICVKGGMTSYFKTSNTDAIHKMVEAGNEEAIRVWRAMAYQTAKHIGALATVLKGEVTAIILTGDLCRFTDLMDLIKDNCGFIAPIIIYPGEYEHEAMTNAALKILRKEEQLKKYLGVPVFKGFKEDL